MIRRVVESLRGASGGGFRNLRERPVPHSGASRSFLDAENAAPFTCPYDTRGLPRVKPRCFQKDSPLGYPQLLPASPARMVVHIEKSCTPDLDEGVTPELREDDLLKILGHPDNQPRTLRLRRARAILVVLYEIGCREDELSAWTRRRFRQNKDEDGKPYWYIQFVQKLSRTRYSRLSDNVMNMLFEMWDIMGFTEDEDHAAFPSIGRRNFGGPIQRGTISNDIDILYANAGVGHLIPGPV